jgi:hypothetical protein
MGTTPLPAALTVDEVNKTYQFINNNCDIVSHHFDEGISYQEAFTNAAMLAKLFIMFNLHSKILPMPKRLFLSGAALSI